MAEAATKQLRQHLLDSGICGDVATSREENLRNIGRMLQGREGYHFGLTPDPAWSRDGVLEVMARLCGINPDPAYDEGQDTISAELCVAALGRLRDRLALAAARHERVLVATGHPTGTFAMHLAMSAALTGAGAAVLRPDVDNWWWPWEHDTQWARSRPRHLRAFGGVHVLAAGGELLHTHAPEPGRVLFDACASDPPDLVVADHGFAGAAAAAGHEVLAFADCNDPALFVAEAEGLAIITVPLDDNVRPHLYDPLSQFLTSW